MTQVLPNLSELITNQYFKKAPTLIIASVVGYHYLYFRIIYILCIIHDNYEPVYSSS